VYVPSPISFIARTKVEKKKEIKKPKATGRQGRGKEKKRKGGRDKEKRQITFEYSMRSDKGKGRKGVILFEEKREVGPPILPRLVRIIMREKKRYKLIPCYQRTNGRWW